ncbi:MAG: hypothetical protein IPP04_20110 [Saprospiraceae bacterium]|nr:hypothetical protein [Saprospiraceae bacterium]
MSTNSTSPILVDQKCEWYCIITYIMARIHINKSNTIKAVFFLFSFWYALIAWFMLVSDGIRSES